MIQPLALERVKGKKMKTNQFNPLSIFIPLPVSLNRSSSPSINEVDFNENKPKNQSCSINKNIYFHSQTKKMIETQKNTIMDRNTKAKEKSCFKNGCFGCFELGTVI